MLRGRQRRRPTLARGGATAQACAAALLSAVLAGCSGGGGGGAGGGGDSAGRVSFDDPLALPERYVSTIDSSATADAVAAGLDPRYEILPATFDCHDEADSDLSVPDRQVAFYGEDSYATPEGEGRIAVADDEEEPSRERQFRGGPLDGEVVYLRFDDFGQSFALNEGGGEYTCYQAGASAARARLLAYLATPRSGDYRCREAETGETVTIALDARGGYAVGAERGGWTLEDVVDNASGAVRFEGGPLDGERARYSEEQDTGYRSFSVSTTEALGPLGLGGASSSLSLTCEAFGPPVTLPLYGPAPAPSLPSGGERLQGFWWYDDIRRSGSNSDFYAGYLLLRGDGWAYTGTPPVAGVDCTRTRPNGLPFCDAYALDGDELTLYAPYGEVGSKRLEREGGTLTSVDGDEVRPVAAVDPASLAGEYENLSYFQSGCVGLGYCSYGLTTRRLGFTPDGRFLQTSTGSGGSSFDASSYGGVSTYAVSSSSSGNVGDWRLDGNVLELAYDSGRTVRRFAVHDGGSIGVDGLLYLPGWTD